MTNATKQRCGRNIQSLQARSPAGGVVGTMSGLRDSKRSGATVCSLRGIIVADISDGLSSSSPRLSRAASEMEVVSVIDLRSGPFLDEV